MITLRIFLLVALILAYGNVNATKSQSWNFKVYLGEKEIGEHIFNLTTMKNSTHVTSKARFNVKLLFINAYRYKHRNYEVWNGNCLNSIYSVTNDNGKKFQVIGERQKNKLHVRTREDKFTSKGCTKTFSYWDPSFLKNQTLLNPQTGELESVSVEFIGNDEITVRNTPTFAKHYRVTTNKFIIDLWYSKDDEWLALNSTTQDGYTLRYKIQ